MVVLEEVAEHDEVGDHTVLVLHEDGGSQTNVGQHRLLQQGQHSPLMVIVRHVAVGPDGTEGVPEIYKGTKEGLGSLRAGLAKPDLVGAVSNVEGTKLSKQPRNNHSDGGGQDEPRNTAEGTLGDGSERIAVLAGAGLTQRLQSADETGEETEDGDAYAALRDNAEDGHLP